MPAFASGFASSIAIALLASLAAAQDSVSLASKSIVQVYAIRQSVFAFASFPEFAEGGVTYSQLDSLHFGTPKIRTRSWPWNGGPESGAPWRRSLLLRANYLPSFSDSLRVARVTVLRDNGTFRGGDSLVFRDLPNTDTTAAARILKGARLTALAVRDSTSSSSDSAAVTVLGFGRLGIAYARLANEFSSAAVFVAADTLVNFLAFPAQSDTALSLYACRWNRLCRVDTLSGLPPRDSVIAVAIDSSAPDSAWLLIATDRGLRRGRLGGTVFPYVTLPGVDSAAVRSVFTEPSRGLAWAFTGSRFFFSDDHGVSFRVPPAMPGVFDPSTLVGYSNARPPSAAFYGDTTIINFNLDRPGLILFRRDTILANIGQELGKVLLDTADTLGISRDEGELTALAVSRGTNPAQAVLVVGSTFKGVFFRRLDQPGTAFTNLNRLKGLKNALGEVITYPTLFTGAAEDPYVHIGYRLKKDARVTITVYNYAMEKVRGVVKNAPRRGGTGVARSENIAEDRWDGRDAGGRFVSVGTYYVLVESDGGDKAFGKILVTRGRK